MAEENLFQKVCERLHSKDYKVTRQREIILHTFMDYADRHLSAEELHSLVKEQHPEIGLATVYRTLDILSELGVVHKNDFGDGRARYEISHQDEQHHHHHLICLTCGRVAEFDDYLLESLEAQIYRKCKFKVEYHNLKLYGYCQECSQLIN